MTENDLPSGNVVHIKWKNKHKNTTFSEFESNNKTQSLSKMLPLPINLSNQ